MAVRFIITAIFGLVLLLILGYLVSPLNSWVHPEIQLIDNYLIKSHEPFYKNLFNWQALEFAPRYTRPISTLVQILDSKVRYKLPPIFLAWLPSFSFVWLIVLVVNPLLVTKLCKLLGLSITTTAVVATMYLLSSSNLSDLVMMFRPGKPLAQMCLILTAIYAIELCEVKNKSFVNYKLWFVLLCGVLSDEAGWMGVATAGLLLINQKHIKDNAIRYLIGFLLIVVVYTIQLMIHRYISDRLWGFSDSIGSYFILKPLLEDPLAAIPVLLVEVANLTLSHILIFYRDLTGFYPLNKVSILALPIMVVSGIGVLSLLISGLASKEQKSGKYCRTFFALGLISLCFHSLLMAVVGNKVFGPYYYAGFVTFFMIMSFGVAFDNIYLKCQNQKSKMMVLTIPLSCVVSALYVFCATNQYIKYIHYYRPGTTEYREMFRNDVDRFKTPVQFLNPYMNAKSLIKGGCVDLPVELLWLATDLKAVNGAGFPPGDITMRVCR